jgi:uncharacterized protein with HXXEE motif
MPWFFWLFPIAFAIHNIEEALWFPEWSRSAGRFHRGVGTFEFTFAVIVLTLVSVIITTVFAVRGRLSVASEMFFAFNLGMLLNVFVPHLAATIALRRYCPGLLTGVVLLVPTTTYLLVYGYRHQYIVAPRFWFVAIPFLALLVASIPVLFWTGRLLASFARDC